MQEGPTHVLLHIDELQGKVHGIRAGCKPAVLVIFPEEKVIQVVAHAEELMGPTLKPGASLSQDVLPHSGVIDDEFWL